MSPFLNIKQPASTEAIADDNVAAVGPCCLDVHSKPAYLMRGRWGMVWGMIWFAFFSSVGAFYFPILFDILLGKKLLSNFPDAPYAAILFFVGFGLSLLPPLYIWRTHLPMRFNRKTRKVYFHHRGQVYITDWDNIRAYLSVQSSPVPYAGRARDPQVNIEFPLENGRYFTVPLVASRETPTTLHEMSARLWEYIRLYMEEGPEALPLRINQLEMNLSEWYHFHSPFPLFRRRTFFGILLEPVAFPIRLYLFLVNLPTDILYQLITRRIKMIPFPPEMVEPCRCSETAEEKKARIHETLESLETKIGDFRSRIEHTEQFMLSAYKQWFVDLRFPGHEHLKVTDGLPEGWYRVPLTDLVELNPPLNFNVDGELRYVSVSALPERGLLIERDKLERRPSPTPTTFRNGDILFPLTSPWLEKRRAAFVSFLIGFDVTTDDFSALKLLFGYEVGGTSADLIVMRPLKISPGFAFCLATDPRLRRRAQRIQRKTPEEKRIPVSAVAEYKIPMPPLALFEQFEKQYIRRSMKEILELENNAEYLSKIRKRIIANAASLANETDSVA